MQYTFGNLTSPLSGTEFIDTHLEPWRDALHSTHSGSSRPSYAVEGMLWLDTSGTPAILKMFDGTSDDVVLGTINLSTLEFVPAGTSEWAGTSGGTANAQTLTPDIALGEYAAGVAYEFIVGYTNTTAAPTINISGLGAVTVKCSVGGGKVNLPPGGLQSGMVARIVHDGTDIILLNLRPHNAGADIASASTLNLDNATGDFVHITGTTTVTAITISRGRRVTCIADGAFTLTDGSGNSPQGIVCPGGADITTAAGDIFTVRGDVNGTARIENYISVGNGPKENKVNAIGSIGGGTQDIDLDLGRSVSATVDTSTTTFTFSNFKASGTEDIFTLRLTNGGSQTINWPASVEWGGGGDPPELTESGVDELTFKTIDGGTTVVGVAVLDVQ